MKRLFAAAVLMMLAGCGQQTARQTDQQAAQSMQSSDGACALLSQPAQLFGAEYASFSYDDIEGAEGSCEIRSADGLRAGELIHFTATNAQAKMAEIADQFDADTATALADVSGVGDAAKLATDLPGYQAQIVFRKGDDVVAMLARSGDPETTAADLARQLAAQVTANL